MAKRAQHACGCGFCQPGTQAGRYVPDPASFWLLGVVFGALRTRFSSDDVFASKRGDPLGQRDVALRGRDAPGSSLQLCYSCAHRGGVRVARQAREVWAGAQEQDEPAKAAGPGGDSVQGGDPAATCLAVSDPAGLLAVGLAR